MIYSISGKTFPQMTFSLHPKINEKILSSKTIKLANNKKGIIISFNNYNDVLCLRTSCLLIKPTLELNNIGKDVIIEVSTEGCIGLITSYGKFLAVTVDSYRKKVVRGMPGGIMALYYFFLFIYCN